MPSQASLLACLLLAALTAAACRPAPSPETKPVPSAASSQAAPLASAAPRATGAPLDRLIPPSRPGSRAQCPLTIEPGVGFGPALLGETLADLERAGLKPRKDSETHAELPLDKGGVLKLSLCQGKIIEVWLDDLRKGPECVMYEGKPVARTVPLDALMATIGGCDQTDHRTGGSHERCQQGGVYLGHGMGDFVQIRVTPRSIPFDNACAIASDDGSLVELSPDVRVELLKKVLLLPQLGAYWHVDRPGRDPLRIIKTPLVRAEPLTMFGSPVQWIDESEAGGPAAFFRVTRLDATQTRATVEFAYPVEGVRGTAVFQNRSGTWSLEKASVSER